MAPSRTRQTARKSTGGPSKRKVIRCVQIEQRRSAPTRHSDEESEEGSDDEHAPCDGRAAVERHGLRYSSAVNASGVPASLLEAFNKVEAANKEGPGRLKPSLRNVIYPAQPAYELHKYAHPGADEVFSVHGKRLIREVWSRAPL